MANVYTLKDSAPDDLLSLSFALGDGRSVQFSAADLRAGVAVDPNASDHDKVLDAGLNGHPQLTKKSDKDASPLTVEGRVDSKLKERTLEAAVNGDPTVHPSTSGQVDNQAPEVS